MKEKNKQTEKNITSKNCRIISKKCNIHVIRILERGRKSGSEERFKVIMAKNFPKLIANTKPQI